MSVDVDSENLLYGEFSVALGIPFVLAYVAYVWWAMNRTKIKIEDTGDHAAY